MNWNPPYAQHLSVQNTDGTITCKPKCPRKDCEQANREWNTSTDSRREKS